MSTERFTLQRRSPRDRLAYLLDTPHGMLARELWLQDHGEAVLKLIDAAEAYEPIPDKWSNGDERAWLYTAYTYFTTPESGRTDATK